MATALCEKIVPARRRRDRERKGRIRRRSREKTDAKRVDWIDRIDPDEAGRPGFRQRLPGLRRWRDGVSVHYRRRTESAVVIDHPDPQDVRCG